MSLISKHGFRGLGRPSFEGLRNLDSSLSAYHAVLPSLLSAEFLEKVTFLSPGLF